MNKAIVIGTYHGREDWLGDCLGSLAEWHETPIITVTVPWELNVIRWVYESTKLDEWIFLQDTVVIRDYDWLLSAFLCAESVSLSHKPFFMYLGKYQRKVINAMHPRFPTINSKRDSVAHEDDWTMQYVEASGGVTSYWDFYDTEIFEHRHGRNNMVIENEHIIKYKGTWRHDQVPGWYS